MKIIESSADRLVAQNKGISSYITGGVLLLAGVAAVPIGLSKHSVPIWGFGAGALVVGALLIVFTKSELLTADRTSASVSVVMKGLTGQKQASYPFDQISEVRAVQHYEQSSNTNNNGMRPGGSGISFGTGGVGMGNAVSMRLVTVTQLILTTGQSVDVEHTSRNATGALLSNRSTEGIGQVLATVVGKPYQLVAPNMNPVAMVAEVVQAFRGGQTGESVVPTNPVTAPVAPVPSPVPAVAPTVTPVQPMMPEAAPRPIESDGPGFAMPSVPTPPTPPSDQPPQV